MFSTLKMLRSQKFVWELSKGIRTGNLENIRAQVNFKKSKPEKEKCLR
jgi:hypothetical protein